jgi:flagellar hook assembly protein FlgD
VDLTVYDVTGRTVKTLVNGDLKAGENSIVWDGTDNSANRVSGGIFWTQMSTNGFTSSKKMVVLR